MTSDHVRQAGPIVIDIENITKDYVMGEEIVHALRSVTLRIRRNEYIAIMGPSGSGKSTLMNMLGCLDTPTSGRYEFNSKNVAEMDDDELAAVRNREIGFVSVSAIVFITNRTNFPAANVSAWPSRARSSTDRQLFWPTSPPAISIPRPAKKSWSCSRICMSAVTQSSS